MNCYVQRKADDDDKPKLSKKQLRKQSRYSVAQLKQVSYMHFEVVLPTTHFGVFACGAIHQ